MAGRAVPVVLEGRAGLAGSVALAGLADPAASAASEVPASPAASADPADLAALVGSAIVPERAQAATAAPVPRPVLQGDPETRVGLRGPAALPAADAPAASTAACIAAVRIAAAGCTAAAVIGALLAAAAVGADAGPTCASSTISCCWGGWTTAWAFTASCTTAATPLTLV